MKFMSLILTDPNQGEAPQALMDAMGPYIEASFKSGVLIDTGGLGPVGSDTYVRLSDGNIQVIDGPFSETKELVGGYAILNCASQAEAVQAAKDFLALHVEHWPEWKGTCEVRQIFGPND